MSVRGKYKTLYNIIFAALHSYNFAARPLLLNTPTIQMWRETINSTLQPRDNRMPVVTSLKATSVISVSELILKSYGLASFVAYFFYLLAIVKMGLSIHPCVCLSVCSSNRRFNLTFICIYTVGAVWTKPSLQFYLIFLKRIIVLYLKMCLCFRHNSRLIFVTCFQFVNVVVLHQNFISIFTDYIGSGCLVNKSLLTVYASLF